MATFYVPSADGWDDDSGYPQKLRLRIEQTYNSAQNTSSLSIYVEMKKIQTLAETFWSVGSGVTNSITVNGSSVATSADFSGKGFLMSESSAWVGLRDNNYNAAAPFTCTVSHNADGSASIPIVVKLSVAAAGGWRTWRDSPHGEGTLTFQALTYTLTISAGTGSTITVKRSGTTLSNGATITRGDALTVTFGASSGYALATHTVNGSSFTSGGTHTVTGNVTVAATATSQTYTLTLSAGTGSTITVKRSGTTLSNGAALSYGDVLTVTFGASSGYALSTHTVNGSSFTSGGTHTVTGSVTVAATATVNAAASTITSSSSSVQTQGSFSLTVSRQNASYYHKATFRVSGTTLSTSSAFATTLSYTVPRSWFDGYTTSTTLNVTVSVQTFTDSACTTTVGSPATASVTAYADSGMKPTITNGFATVAAYNGSAQVTGYIQGHSKARLTLTRNKVTLCNNATVTSYLVRCQGSDQSVQSPGATETVTTAKLTAASAIKITITVTDSRGRTDSTELTVTPTAYVKPTISEVSVFRCNSQGQASETGAYYSAKATANYSSLGGQNSVTLTAKHKATSAANYGSETTLTSGTASVLGGSLSSSSTYIVMLTATDALGNAATVTVTIPSLKWALKFRDRGQGAAFGKAAERDDALELPSGWKLYIGSMKIGEDTGWVENNAGTAAYRCLNGQVTIVVNATETVIAQASTWTQILTLPEAYRPTRNVGAALIGGSQGEYIGMLWVVANTGIVYVYFKDAAPTTAHGSLGFPV